MKIYNIDLYLRTCECVLWLSFFLHFYDEIRVKKSEHEERSICVVTFLFIERDEWTKTACLLVIQISELPCYFPPSPPPPPLVFH